jgi:hypothetical protein
MGPVGKVARHVPAAAHACGKAQQRANRRNTLLDLLKPRKS